MKAWVLKEFCEIDTGRGTPGKSLPLKKEPLDLVDLPVLEKGGRVVINAIRKVNPLPELDYERHVWHEKEIKSVANVARRDAIEFLPLAAEIGIRPEVQAFEFESANPALVLLKQGRMHGAGVLRVS